MKFSTILRDELLASPLGREKFAEHIGVSRSTLNKYLAGDTEPTFSAACEILRKCDRNVIIAKHYSYEEYFPRAECDKCHSTPAKVGLNYCESCIEEMRS